MSVTARVTHAADGEPLAYRVLGRAGELPPILTVHGLVSSVEHWTELLPHYAARRECVSWDYRGHGSQPVPRDCAAVGVSQFAADAHAVWRAAGIAPAVVVGLSFGVQVSLEIWRSHREAVRALVLVCGTAGHPFDRVTSSAFVRRSLASFVRALAARRAFAQPILEFLRSRAGTRLACELAYASGGARRGVCPPAMLEDLFAHVGSLDPDLLGAVISGYLEHTAWEVLPTITVPTLIIAGDRDQLTPVSIAERMHRAIAGSELVVFAGHSHLVQVEKPREVHAAIDTFLARHRL
jgi:pimeloyl-ACP methyl ester carboxylesterase